MCNGTTAEGRRIELPPVKMPTGSNRVANHLAVPSNKVRRHREPFQAGVQCLTRGNDQSRTDLNRVCSAMREPFRHVAVSSYSESHSGPGCNCKLWVRDSNPAHSRLTAERIHLDC